MTLRPDDRKSGANTMDTSQLLPPFEDLLVKKDYSAYARLLSRDGIDWWLDFQFPRIAQHFAPLEQFPSHGDPHSTRLDFLKKSAGSGTSLSNLDDLYCVFLKENDIDAACACISTAFNTIWESGREFGRFSVWKERSERLWNSDELSPLAHGSLLLHFCFAEIAAGGDIPLVYTHLKTILSLAQKLQSPSVFLMSGVLGAYIYCWKADFAALEIILDDMDPYLFESDASPVAIMQHQISRGLFTIIQGKPEEGLIIFKRLLAAPNLEQMPPSVWLLLHGHYLYGLVSSGKTQEIEKIVKILREKAIPAQNQYFHAYLHFNLGVAALAQSRPHKALLHGERALQYGDQCNSANAVRMSALLLGQALADLERYDDALEHFSRWLPIWRDTGYLFIASLASVEIAYMFLRQNNVQKAGEFLQNGYDLLPKQEKLLSCYRPADYVIKLEQALLDTKRCNKLIRITTLGKFTVTIGNIEIDEQKWGGIQSKNLLQVIISLGGQNIPTSYLADLLWPDSEGDLAINSFKVCLHRLRKAVQCGVSDCPWLVVRQKQISLSPTLCSVDAHFFEEEIKKVLKGIADSAAISYALSLYTGNFLTTKSDESWHIRKKEELRDYFVRASLLLFKHYKKDNDVETGIPYLITALKYDPLNETLLCHLMESYISLDNRGKALEIYDTVCHSLKEELHLAPGKPLRSLALKARGSM